MWRLRLALAVSALALLAHCSSDDESASAHKSDGGSATGGKAGSGGAKTDAKTDSVASGGGSGGASGGTTSGDADIDAPPPTEHVFDFASKMPAHLGVMFSMSWFGIPQSGDPNGAGTDPGWGNWKWGSAPCVPTNDPTKCESVGGKMQRDVASKRHPLAGIYSSTGRDEESLRRIDLMLSTLRRPCSQGALIDGWSVQLDTIRYTSRYHPEGDPNFTISGDNAYRAFVAFFERADKAGMTNVLLPGNDTTWYWHFGDKFGLDTQAERLKALEDDIVDTIEIANQHSSAMRFGGKLLLYFYTGGTGSSPYISVEDWKNVLYQARDRSGFDFYTVGGTGNADYFEVFDAIAPWLETGVWNASQGATTYDRAKDWTRRRHEGLAKMVSSWPGRVVWGGIAPGFDDYTRNWGAKDSAGNCMDRLIPRAPEVLAGQFDWLSEQRAAGTLDARGMIFETWDDWTEGSEFEPAVEEGPAKLVELRDRLGQYFGDSVDPTDKQLETRWTSYAQARNCAGGSVTLPPAIDLSCP